mgnify:CR=1 FL=1
MKNLAPNKISSRFLFRLASIAMPTIAVFLIVVPILSYSSVDFTWSSSINIKNESGGTTVNTLVRIPINASALVDAGALSTSGVDTMAVMDNVEIPRMFQMDGDTSWWVVTPSLNDNETKTLTLYTGTDTPSLDNPQGFYVADTASWATQTTDSAFWRQVVQRFYLNSVTFDALPSSGNYGIMFYNYLSAAGPAQQVIWAGDGVIKTENQYMNGSALNYECATTCIQANTQPVDIYVMLAMDYLGSDEANHIVVRNSRTKDIIYDATGSADVGDGLMTSVGQRLGNYNQMNGLKFYVQEILGNENTRWDFAPTDFNQVNVGNAANSYKWRGNLKVDSGCCDMFYTIVSNTNNYDVTVGGIVPRVLARSGAAAPSDSTTPIAPNDPSMPISDPYTALPAGSTSTADFGFPFNILADGANGGQIPLNLLAMTIVMVGAVLAGFGGWIATRMTGVSVIAAALVGSALIYMTPVSNVMMLFIIITALMLVILLPRPFDSAGRAA